LQNQNEAIQGKNSGELKQLYNNSIDEGIGGGFGGGGGFF
jgi:hypothetical protein